MILVILTAILSTLFTVLMSVFVLSGYYIILWIFLGFVLFYMIHISVLLIYTLFFKTISPFVKIKSYIFYAIATFAKTFIFNMRIKYHNREKLPNDLRPLAIIANHKSNIDPIFPVLLFRNKRALSFTPKSDLYKYPFIRTWLYSLRCIKVDRNNDRNSLKELIKGIDFAKKGLVYIFYPEGGIKSRDIDEMVEESKPGAYKLPIKAKCDILPLSVIGSKMMSKNSRFKTTKIDVVLNDVIKYEDYENLSTTELATKVRDIINNTIIDFKKNKEKK